MAKTPKWLKWIYGIVFGFLGLIVILVFFIHSLEKPHEITSWEEWEKHRGLIEAFSNNVAISKDATRMFVTANDYWKDGFYNRCDLDACGEYKGFIRAAKEAAQDGILTPSELVDIAKSHALLKATINSKNLEFKNKFKK